MNGDVLEALEQYDRRLLAAGDCAEVWRWQRQAAGKLIRSIHVLRNDDDRDWPISLAQHRQWLARTWPQPALALDYFMQQAQQPVVDVVPFRQRLAALQRWLRAGMESAAAD